MIQESMSLKYEPASVPQHIYEVVVLKLKKAEAVEKLAREMIGANIVSFSLYYSQA